ncbi:glycerophosphodiester phosphodiesterase [Thermodesulfobacteriota bacterium]
MKADAEFGLHNNLLCIGHRGAMGHEPENTIASIERALELGAHCVEVDVQYIDRNLLVFHDDRLERTTNGKGYIASKDFEYLRSLDAGEGQQIPTLEEVLDAVDMRAGVNIELKGRGTAQPVADLVKRYRRKGWSHKLIMVSSFDHRELMKVRVIDGTILLGVLYNGIPVNKDPFAIELGAYSVHPSVKFVDREFVEDAHGSGLRVYVFTVNNNDQIDRMKGMGVDGVFTNYPERVVSINSVEGLANEWI